MIITTRTCCCYCCCCSLKTALFLYCMLFLGVSVNFVFSSHQLVGLLNVRTTWFTFFPAIETIILSRKFVKLFLHKSCSATENKTVNCLFYSLCLVISSPLLHLCLSQTFYFVCPLVYPSTRPFFHSINRLSINLPARQSARPSTHAFIHLSTHPHTNRLSYQPPNHASFHPPNPNPSIRPLTQSAIHPSKHPSSGETFFFFNSVSPLFSYRLSFTSSISPVQTTTRSEKTSRHPVTS